MNETLLPIFSRRSVRRFEAREVSESLIHDILEAAMAAPSAVAKDPWHFVVVKDPARREAIAEGLPNGKFLASAAVALVVVGDLDKAHDRQLSYLLQDCTAAVENALLAASMLGLGACWLGVHPREDRVRHVREVCRMPETMLPLAVIALGHPGEEKEPRTRYQRSRVHFETW